MTTTDPPALDPSAPGPARAATPPDATPPDAARPDTVSADTAALVDYLRDRDVTCPLCRYNLRGLQAARCPECGRELVLSVGLAEPLLKAWITMTAALLLPAGIGVLFGIMFTREGFPVNEPHVMLLVLLFMAHVPAAAAALWLRRRFLALSPAAQWGWAAGAIGSAVLAFTLFVTSVD